MPATTSTLDLARYRFSTIQLSRLLTQDEHSSYECTFSDTWKWNLAKLASTAFSFLNSFKLTQCRRNLLIIWLDILSSHHREKDTDIHVAIPFD